MNSSPPLPIDSHNPLFISLLLVTLAFCCWFGYGPRGLCWPLVALVVLITSGHDFGKVAVTHLKVFAGPLFTLFLMLFGLRLLFRGIGWHPRRYHHRDHNRYGRRRHDDRW